MMRPDFLVIGAAKSGTSSLYHYLGQHPQIYMSSIKEPAFFAYEGQIVQFRGPGDERRNGRTITDLCAYNTLFEGAKSSDIAGEASVVYLYSPTAPARIKHYVPDVKLIAILRHPVERAFSSFLHMRREGHEPFADFAQALQAEDERVNANWQYLWHYRRLGFYYEQLQRYYDLFPSSRLKVYLYEDFRADPNQLLRDIYSFLDVDPAFCPDTSHKHNVSGTVKSRALHSFLRSQTTNKRVLKSLIPASLRSQLRKMAFQWNISPVKPILSQDVRADLLNLYREDILRLQDLTQRDLCTWLKV